MLVNVPIDSEAWILVLNAQEDALSFIDFPTLFSL